MSNLDGMTRLERFAHRRAQAAWTRLADRAERLSPATLAQLRQSARALRAQIARFERRAQARTEGPVPGRDIIDTPAQCDWAWRPACWRAPIAPAGIAAVPPATRLGEGLQLFHDCPLGEVTLHQIRATDPHAKAPYGVAIDVLGFEGSFCSLVFDFPDAGRTTMRRSHIVRLEGLLDQEHPAPAYARLNVKHGPNTEQIVSQLAPDDQHRFVCEFDLGHAQMNERRLENVWLDIIFERPAMNRIAIADLTVMRRPRAEA